MCALLLTSHAEHSNPLDPLTPAEISLASKVTREEAKFKGLAKDENTQFVFVDISLQVRRELAGCLTGQSLCQSTLQTATLPLCVLFFKL